MHLLSLALLLATPGVPAEPREELNRAAEARLKKDVTFLASDRCEGRGPNTAGLDRAADYIAAEFARIGLRPGMKDSYFQPFKIRGAVGTFTLVGPQGQTIELQQKVHYQPLGLDQGGTATGRVAFVGYGVTSATPDYDDYDGIDVKGKVVVLFLGTPRDKLPGGTVLAKLSLAEKNGAVAALLVNDAEASLAGDNLLDSSYASLGRGRHLLALAVRRRVVEAVLPPDRTLTGIEKAIARDLKPSSFDLPGWTATVKVEVKPEVVPLKNVVGVLEGAGPLANQTVVVGAHYDHLGYGSGRSSRATVQKPAIHHGADDNGSGTTGMLELARRFAAMPNRQGRRIVFLAFSGEEIALLGSQHYCKEPLYPLAETAAMLNLDMIGRLPKDEKTGLFRMRTEGHGTAKEFKELIDNQAKKHGFVLTSQASGNGPSDHDSFCMKKVPVLFFWTGVHDDYHRPSDTADKIDLGGMRRVLEFSGEVLATFTTMARPAFVEVKGSAMGRPSSGPRLGLRPGYNEGEEGVAVEAVSDGGVAAKGGIKTGDRIVQIAGKETKDIGAYMQALAAQKVGSTIEVVVLRDKKKVTLKVTLE